MFKIFDKKTGSEAIINQVPTQKLHKPVVKIFQKRKVYVKFKDNVWAPDFAEIGWRSYFNWGVSYLLSVIFFHQICLG